MTWVLTPKPAARRGAMLQIRKSLIDVRQARHDLTISNGAYWSALKNGNPTEHLEPKLELFREDDTFIWLPRNYQPRWRNGVQPTIVSSHVTTVVEPVVSRIQLRDKVQQEASLALQRPGADKILALACGKGKSVVALDAAAKRPATALPLLIVVHTEDLMSQWKERIEEFWGIPRADIGHIQGKILDYEGKQVTVAMLHTLCLRAERWKTELPSIFSYFKVAVFDEIHRLGADFFSSACSMFVSERWGLSATLKRDDGMDKVIRLHCGEVAYENLEQALKPECIFVRTGIKVNEHRYRMRNGRINLSRLTTDLSQHESRNQLILRWINKAARKGRKVLSLGERTEQLKWLYDNVNHDSKSMCVGAVKSKDGERFKALQKDVVMATQHLAKEGLDRKEFDTEFIFFPFSGEGRLRQSIGRILRLVDNVDKKPIVVIFEDDIGVMRAMCNKMRNNMYRLGFPYKEVFA